MEKISNIDLIDELHRRMHGKKAVPQQKDVALEQETKDNQQTIVKVDGQNNTIVKRKQYSAVCSDCGANTTVPFKPDMSRPIYCLDCFKKRN